MKNPATAIRRRGIYLLPNLFTIGSLFAGFYAIIAAFKGDYEYAVISIFIAMIMDSLDGRVARLTNTMTAFGAELDSLADMVSFAIAPATLAYSWGLNGLGKIGWLAAFIYMVAVALRLARFNTQISKSDKRYFQGIPCTAAAPVVTSLIWIFLNFDLNSEVTGIITIVTMVLLGMLMVSNIRYRSFKDFNLKHHVPFVVILAVVLIIVLISVDPAIVIFVVSAGFAISGPIGTIWGLRQKKQLRKIQLRKSEEAWTKKK